MDAAVGDGQKLNWIEGRGGRGEEKYHYSSEKGWLNLSSQPNTVETAINPVKAGKPPIWWE